MCLLLILFSLFVLQSIYAVSCPKGTFISKSVGSGCQPCPNGTYSDTVDSVKCVKCDECRGRHNRVTQVCTPTSNTKCTCEPGFYYDKFLYCLKCQPCKKGKGVVKNCTSVSNTVCDVCEKVGKPSEMRPSTSVSVIVHTCLTELWPVST